MEEYQKLFIEGTKKVDVADYLLTQTYPLLKEPKLLLSVVNNLSKGCELIMDSVLCFERLYKRIPPYTNNFEQKTHVFKEKIVKRYSLNTEIINTIQDLSEIITKHNKSPIEFSRNDKFVICSPDYEMKTISVDKIKRYINSIKLLINNSNKILKKND